MCYTQGVVHVAEWCSFFLNTFGIISGIFAICATKGEESLLLRVAMPIGLCLAILAAFLQNRICSSHHTTRQLLLHQVITIHAYTASVILNLLSTCIYYPHVGEVTALNISVLITFILFFLATACYSWKLIVLTEFASRHRDARSRSRAARRAAHHDCDDDAVCNGGNDDGGQLSVVFSPFHWLPSYDEVVTSQSAQQQQQQRPEELPPRYSTLHLNIEQWLLDTETAAPVSQQDSSHA